MTREFQDLSIPVPNGDDLNLKCPASVYILNVWYLIGGTTLEGLERWSLLEKVGRWGQAFGVTLTLAISCLTFCLLISCEPSLTQIPVIMNWAAVPQLPSFHLLLAE